jgi:hypothetical protein
LTYLVEAVRREIRFETSKGIGRIVQAERADAGGFGGTLSAIGWCFGKVAGESALRPGTGQTIDAIERTLIAGGEETETACATDLLKLRSLNRNIDHPVEEVSFTLPLDFTGDIC